MKKIIREYTREAGVRNLEREIATILRKLAKEIVTEYGKEFSPAEGAILDNDKFVEVIKKRKYVLDEDSIVKYLKNAKFKDKKEQLEDKVGVVTGLAWTSVGGEILPIEATIMPGTEKLTLTGKLGDVMKESAMAALSFVRSNWNKLGISEDFAAKKEVHIHVPEGAIPKDGPSAGITITTAILSLIKNKVIPNDISMTGEITLRGRILPVGGLKEKLIAASVNNIKKVFIPIENKIDINEIPNTVTNKIEIIYVRDYLDVYYYLFNEQ